MADVDMVMPQMGESIAEGTIIKWLKKEGETVGKDEIILEISTDKVDSEIPSPHAGVITKLLASEGETVNVGAVIAKIQADGEGAASELAEDAEPVTEGMTVEEATPQPVVPDPTPMPAPVVAAPIAVPEVTSVPQPESTVSMPELQPSGFAGIPRTDSSRTKFFSPLVRSIAKAEGVSPQELETVDGSGINGRVTKKDILGYIGRRSPVPGVAVPAIVPAPAAAPDYVPPAQPTFADTRVEIIPMDTMRKSIAKHMVASVQTSPHVFAVSEADMTNLVRFREREKAGFQQREGFKLTYMPFIIQACAHALRDFPLVNSSADGDQIVRKKYINIGVAVALENNGLIVPVIKGADGMNIVGLARIGNDLAQRARGRKLKPEEVQDGTFSITNMGVFGSLMGLPIINQPQVAILGVGVIQKRPVVRSDAIAIRDMMYISLSFDHRIVDGALAGQFLERIAFYLTNYDTETLTV
jgi:2-oxoglutarate dehydrogenase E2 component (dihydrolipoamide succinyltransferase)